MNYTICIISMVKVLAFCFLHVSYSHDSYFHDGAL